MKKYYKIFCFLALIEFGLAPQVETFAQKNRKTKETSSKKNDPTEGTKDEKSDSLQENRVAKNAIIIAFDETGQMIKFPKSVIKRNQEIAFEVRVNRSTFAAHINKLFLKLDSTFDFFVNNPENQFVLYTLFKDDLLKDDTLMVRKWLRELRQYNAMRQYLSKGEEYKLENYINSDTSIFHTYANSLRYIPVLQYFENLLLKQFEIRVYNKGNDISSFISLNPDFKRIGTEDGDCYWWYSKSYLLSTLLGKNCGGCENNLKFSLINNDALKATLLDWYNKQFNKTDSILKKGSAKSGKSVLKEKLEYLVEANGALIKLPTVDEDLVGEIRQCIQDYSEHFIIDPDSDTPPQETPLFRLATSHYVNFEEPPKKDTSDFNIKKYLSTLRSVQPWLFNWLWFNNGYLVVNPLPAYVVPSSDRSKLLDSAKKSQQRYQQQKIFLDSVRVHVADKLSNFQLFKNVQDSTDAVMHQLERINEYINSLNKLIREDSITKAKAETSNTQAGFSGFQAYAGQLPVYNKTKWYQGRALFPVKLQVQKQFSYSASQQTISSIHRNQWQKTMGTEIPENEKALLVIHNIPKNSKIGLTQTLSGYNDLEEFTVLFQKLLKALDSTGLFQLALPAGFAGFSNFLQSTVSHTSRIPAVEAAAKFAGIAAFKTDTVDAFTFNYLQNSARQSPVTFDPNLIVATSITKKIDTSRGYLTKVYPVVDSTAPYQVSIDLKIDSIRAKSTIKVGALRWYQVTAGFAAVNSPREQVSIDTTGRGFRTSSVSNNSSVIAGFKIYPFRTYLRDGGLIPRYPLRRLSAVIAFSVPKPLNNFYIGGGYDIVPGLTFTMGGNISKQNYYQVENDRIVKSATRYSGGGTYYGVTINPVLLVQFVKLFFN